LTSNHNPRREGTENLRVLVADKQDLFRFGLISVLKEVSPQPLIIDESSRYKELVELLMAFSYDLIIVSVEILQGEGFQSLNSFRSDYPETTVLAITSDPSYQGTTDARLASFNKIISTTASKQTYVDILKPILQGPARKTNDVRPPSLKENANSFLKAQGLTNRQTDVLNLIADGKRNREIAQILGLSEGTVKVHVTAIFKALGVKNRTQAMLLAGKRSEKPPKK
jgi:DNA-binding NarL/FixJ family response regulator